MSQVATTHILEIFDTLTLHDQTQPSITLKTTHLHGILRLCAHQFPQLSLMLPQMPLLLQLPQLLLPDLQLERLLPPLPVKSLFSLPRLGVSSKIKESIIE